MRELLPGLLGPRTVGTQHDSSGLTMSLGHQIFRSAIRSPDDVRKVSHCIDGEFELHVD